MTQKHLKEIESINCAITVEKETLLRKLAREESRIDVSFNKINVYLSVLLVVIPLLIATVDYKSFINAGLLIKILFCLLVYSLINIGAYIFQSNSVGKYAYSSFSDLKKSSNKVTEQNWQLYYDWQQTVKKADMYVSFVLNIQKWVKITLLLFVILNLLVVLNVAPKSIESSNHVYTVSIDSIDDVYSDSAFIWHNVLSQLNTDNYDEVIVLYNSNEIDTIYKKLNGFKHQKIK